MYNNIKNNKGFTLIETIVVIFILSLLISITIPNFYLFIKNTQTKENLTTAKNIYISTQCVLNDIILEKHNVSFPTTNDKNIIEKEYDYSKKYQVSNNNFTIDNTINTPIKIILANGGYINGLNYTKWDKDFKEEFFNNVEIVYDYNNFVVKSVSYKGIIYHK